MAVFGNKSSASGIASTAHRVAATKFRAKGHELLITEALASPLAFAVCGNACWRKDNNASVKDESCQTKSFHILILA
jgi:hypothetical protein